jgi:predicted nuclease with TOPRIM domain
MSSRSLSIFTIKQIIDLVCDELIKEDRELPKQLLLLEGQMKKKEEELQQLYRENSRLEQRVRELENDLDILVKVGNQVVEESVPEQLSQEQKEDPHTPPPPMTEEERKQQRKEYLREYRRNYRRKQREKKHEFNM